MKIKYVHTNIIAKDWKKLSLFYQRVFGCKPLAPVRDLRGDWLDRLTCISNSHIAGEHLALPGYDGRIPTLEIFSYVSEASYDNMKENDSKAINKTGLAHLAFEVENIEEILHKIIQEGGEKLGETVSVKYPNDLTATFAYAKDIEGNLLELQNWQKPNG